MSLRLATILKTFSTIALVALTLFLGIVFIVLYTKPIQTTLFQGKIEKTMFPVQSVDTMKYSRDISEQVLNNPESFMEMIDWQTKLVQEVGATHIAIATPYDERFIPVLTLWVESARRHGLSVWFRGNFSGWEEWFGFEKINREEHKALLVDFIRNNPDLFVDGDIFTTCPECENGGPGDPRRTGDKQGYNSFLIEERAIALKEFHTLGKSLILYTSMNGDIAREVITPDALKLLGGAILIDHYVDTPERFGRDIATISEKLSGKVGLGEFGAPIPDLQGTLTQQQQAEFVEQLLYEMYLQRDLIPAVNYWTLVGGSTAIVDSAGKTLLAYDTLQSYFKAPTLYGVVYNSLGEPLSSARVSVASTTYAFDTEGYAYQVFLPGPHQTVVVEKDGYEPVVLTYTTSTRSDVYLTPKDPSLWYRVREYVYGLFSDYTKVTQETFTVSMSPI